MKKGVKENSESVRADYVALLGSIVGQLNDSPDIADMKCLLAGNDEEASFFSNILHVQQHRRQRAMERLTKEVEAGTLQSSNICTIFLPLLEKFVFDANADEKAHIVKGHAIRAIGTLLEGIEWTRFKAIFLRYRRWMDPKLDFDKDAIKLLGFATDALSRAVHGTLSKPSSIVIENPSNLISRLAMSLPPNQILANELTANFIPGLTKFVHYKDESQISLRIPVAVTVIKLLKLLSEEQMAELLPPILLDISHILRSRVQESRDTVRRTLSTIAVILGPTCIGYILKELRTSLARGYQLHVLSFTMHSILVDVSPHLSPGDLDYCLTDLVAVVMDDIFGVVGQEKDNEDYVSQMKEVKRNKSFDSMELLAKSATIPHLTKLVRPLQTLLTGHLSAKLVLQIDKLLRRIGAGLSCNPATENRDILIFAYEVIQDLYRQNNVTASQAVTTDELSRMRFLVQRSTSEATVGTRSSLLYKIAQFALDIVRSTFQKHGSLLTPENVHGFLPVIGDALLHAQDEVKMSSLRLLSAVIKLPMPELDENGMLYIMEVVKIIKCSVNTNTEISQAALKLVAAILRERRNVEIRESDLSYLLRRITPDLEEPERQGVTFNFVKAVMARKLMLPELYELVDKIGIMMVTNHHRSARDIARGVYVHFLLEYPQSKNRWSKQLKFLVKNLEYEYPEGRISIMEGINTLLRKVGDAVAQEIVGVFFMPVVLLMSNDDNADCREMAGALLGQLFKAANAEQLKSILVPLRSWSDQIDKPALTKIGMQVFKVYFDSINKAAESEVPLILRYINQILQVQTSDDDNNEEWALIYHALQLFSTLVATYPSSTLSQNNSRLWSAILNLISHPHLWIQQSAATLVGEFFSGLSKQYTGSDYARVPLTSSHGLFVDGDSMTNILRSSLRVLWRNWTNEDLSAQTVRNLIFLGRCFDANKLIIDVRNSASAGDTDAIEEEQEDSEGDGSTESDSRNSSESAAIDKDSRLRIPIPGIHYLFNALSSILRHEPPKLSSSSLLPKNSTLQLLSVLIPHTSLSTLLSSAYPSSRANTPTILTTLLLPLHHLTDPSIPAPHSTTDSATDLAATHSAMTSSARELQGTIQQRVGDSEYIAALTQVSKLVRERRESRRTKRRIERVAEPEKALREKRRRNERKVQRKKEINVGREGRAGRRGW